MEIIDIAKVRAIHDFMNEDFKYASQHEDHYHELKAKAAILKDAIDSILCIFLQEGPKLSRVLDEIAKEKQQEGKNE